MGEPLGEESFVNVFGKVSGEEEKSNHFYKQWINEASAPYTSQEKVGYEMLKRLYPNHSIVMSQDYILNAKIFGFPGAMFMPLENTPLITNVSYRSGKKYDIGALANNINFGAFALAWDKYEFLLFVLTWPTALSGEQVQHYYLYEGSETPLREMLLRAGKWANTLNEEIWVFDRGFWEKDHGLWEDIQKGNWDDIILDPDFKKAIQKDIYGFWSSESVYKSLGIPWKRGVIMHGPPGNGKTISLKVIMKDCYKKGFSPLYVKSFQSFLGEEAAMAMVFDKARELAPCVIVLEDLDALINPQNRSYFLNQVDGLSGNDGLLLIGTTNHFDRLDPGLSNRPSRFDRKYLFDDPSRSERRLYCAYWQQKLASNPDIEYPNMLAEELSDMTEHFSFAYLKEAHVSALVTLASEEPEDRHTFAAVIKEQVKELRKQLNKDTSTATGSTLPESDGRQTSPRDIRLLLDALSEASAWGDLGTGRALRPSPSSLHNGDIGGRDVRALLDTLPQRGIDGVIARLFERSNQTYDGNVGGRDIRVLLDALSERQRLEPRFFSAGQAEQGNEYRELLDRLSRLDAPKSNTTLWKDNNGVP